MKKRYTSSRQFLFLCRCFLMPLFALSSDAAEFEVLDKLLVNGAATLKSSATIVAPVTQPASLWASTSVVTPHLYVSTAGTVGVRTGAPQGTLDIVSAGSTAGDMAQIWRGGGGVIVSSMSATGVFKAVKILGDISGASGSAGDNLGNHTATTNLSMGAHQIYGSGAVSTYGAFSVNGVKNGWGGINFRSGGSNLGTLMVHVDYQGFYNDTDSGWDWYWTNGTLTAGTVPAARISGIQSYYFRGCLGGGGGNCAPPPCASGDTDGSYSCGSMYNWNIYCERTCYHAN